MNILPSGQVLEPPSTELSDRAKAQTLRGLLDLLLSQIDYTRGMCDVDNHIGTLVKPDFIESVHTALRITK